MIFMHFSAFMFCYPLMSLQMCWAILQSHPLMSLASSLAVERNAAVPPGTRKPFCLAGLWEPLGAPNGFLRLGKSGDTSLSLHGPNLGFAVKRAFLR